MIKKPMIAVCFFCVNLCYFVAHEEMILINIEARLNNLHKFTYTLFKNNGKILH